MTGKNRRLVKSVKNVNYGQMNDCLAALRLSREVGMRLQNLEFCVSFHLYLLWFWFYILLLIKNLVFECRLSFLPLDLSRVLLFFVFWLLTFYFILRIFQNLISFPPCWPSCILCYRVSPHWLGPHWPVRAAHRQTASFNSWPLSGPYAVTWWRGILSIPKALDLAGGGLSQFSSHCGRWLIILLWPAFAIDEQLPFVVGHDSVLLAWLLSSGFGCRRKKKKETKEPSILPKYP